MQAEIWESHGLILSGLLVMSIGHVPLTPDNLRMLAGAGVVSVVSVIFKYYKKMGLLDGVGIITAHIMAEVAAAPLIAAAGAGLPPASEFVVLTLTGGEFTALVQLTLNFDPAKVATG